jgi:hypothetical protein
MDDIMCDLAIMRGATLTQKLQLPTYLGQFLAGFIRLELM